jgi:hypothetical protein
VDAGFEFQPREDVAAGDFGAGFLDAAQAGVGVVEDFEPPAMRLGILLIHREQFGREQPGFVPASGGTDLQDGRTGVCFVFRQQGETDFVLQHRDLRLQRAQFGLGQFLHLGVREQGFGLRLGAFGGAQVADAGHHGLDIGQFA